MIVPDFIESDLFKSPFTRLLCFDEPCNLDKGLSRAYSVSLVTPLFVDARRVFPGHLTGENVRRQRQPQIVPSTSDNSLTAEMPSIAPYRADTNSVLQQVHLSAPSLCLVANLRRRLSLHHLKRILWTN